MNSLSIGRQGELIAAQYVANLGFKIIEKNLKIGHLELDLIAQKENNIYFFEIKTRQNKQTLKEDNLLSSKQIINLKKAAKIYLSLNKNYYQNFYFNLIVVNLVLKTKKADITYYPNIF